MHKVFNALVQKVKRPTLADLFHILDLPKKTLIKDEITGYRVYSSPTDYVQVASASTAAEAIAQSGIDKPFKLERLGTRLANTVETRFITADTPPATAEKVQEQPLESA